MDQILFGIVCTDKYLPIDKCKNTGINVILISKTFWKIKTQTACSIFSNLDELLETAENIDIQVLLEIPDFQTSDLLSDFIQHTAKRKCVIGYQIFPKYKLNEGLTKDALQKLFQNYLLKKFETLENINEKLDFLYLNQPVKSWNGLPDVNHSENNSYVCEFEKFEHYYKADLMEKYFYEIQKHKRNDQFIAFQYDSKLLKIVKPTFFYMTDQYLELKSEDNVTEETGLLRLQTYKKISEGAKSVLYPDWHSFDREKLDEIKKTGEELKALSDDLLHIKKENHVAMIVSFDSYIYLKYKPISKDLSYEKVVQWMHHALNVLNIEFDFISPNADFSKYSMIVTPALYSATEDTLIRLRNYVSNGGVLISSFRLGVTNEFGRTYQDEQPHFLNECFGISYNQYLEPGHVTSSEFDNNDDIQVKYWVELLKPQKAEVIAHYDHKHWAKYAAFTKNSFGEGKAYYIGCYTSEKVIQDLYKLALAECGLFQESISNAWPVVIRKGICPDGLSVYFYLNFSSEDREIICPYESVKELLTGDTYVKEDRISLEKWDVCILKEK